MITADDLATEVKSHGYRADVLYSADDPTNLAVDMVRVWHDRLDRYPSQCVCAPTGEDDGWEWGDRFQHDAPADIGAAELADKVIATLTPQ